MTHSEYHTYVGRLKATAHPGREQAYHVISRIETERRFGALGRTLAGLGAAGLLGYMGALILAEKKKP